MLRSRMATRNSGRTTSERKRSGITGMYRRSGGSEPRSRVIVPSGARQGLHSTGGRGRLAFGVRQPRKGGAFLFALMEASLDLADDRELLALMSAVNIRVVF